MNGCVLSAQSADDAFFLELNESCTHEPWAGEGGTSAAALDQTPVKTHEMQAVLARAVADGQFVGNAVRDAGSRQAALMRALAQLESAKDKLDRVRLRG